MIRTNIPPDDTFLGSLCYESILLASKNEFDFQKFKEDISDIINSKENYQISSVGKNDYPFFTGSGKTREKTLGLGKVYKIPALSSPQGDLIANCKTLVDGLQPNMINLNEIVINWKIEGKKFIISGEEITGLQIFKCDRYSGFTAASTDPYEQKTIYCSPEIAVLFLCGLISSFVVSVKEKQKQSLYFLFFSSDEALRLYIKGDINFIKKYFLIKDKATEVLRESYLRTRFNEVVLTELFLTLKIQELLNKYNLDKISFNLFKIAREGQTYKIYEQIPIVLHRKITFKEVAERCFRNPDIFIRRLNKIFEEKENALWKALRSLNADNKFDEADNTLRAMMYLYRFVILGDPQGYYQFARELHNCYRKTENKAYKEILSKLRVS
jgi:hypothetical protein